MTQEQYDLERKVERLETTVYGNGKGLSSRISVVENELQDVSGWKLGWQNTTNYDDYRSMKTKIEKIDDDVQGLKGEVKKLAFGLAILMTALQFGGDVFNIVKALAF